MAREFLKGVKSENRLSKVRLIMPNDPVIGGQPSDNADEFTSNTPFLDLACSIQYAITQAANANTAAKNADTKAANAQTSANTAKTAADNAQTSANTAKTAAAKADGKAVAAQNTANTAQTSANTAKTAADNAQKTANEAKTAAATADGKAVAAQNTANTANTAAKSADTKATNAQTTATGAKTAADNAQKKANQVPNPLLDQLPIGASGTAFKLITLADLKAKLGVPSAAKLYSGTGQATDGAMTQKAVTDIAIGVGQKWVDVTSQRIFNAKYINTSTKPIQLSIQVRSELSKTGRYEFKVDDKVILKDGGINHIWSSVISAIIPPGSSYLLSNINFDDPQIVIWSELR